LVTCIRGTSAPTSSSVPVTSALRAETYVLAELIMVALEGANIGFLLFIIEGIGRAVLR